MCKSNLFAWAKLSIVFLVFLAAVTCLAQEQTPAAPAVSSVPVPGAGSDAARTVGPAAAPDKDDKDQPAVKTGTGDIPIGVGDLLEIKVFGIQDLSQDARVSGSGEITIALLGPVHVEGLTSMEAERLIEKGLKEAGLVQSPHVTVFTKEYATQGISVLGEVQKPGVYPILTTRRLYDAISLAGGTTSRAGKQVTITRRDRPDEPLTAQLSDSPADTAKGNVQIYPGDTIVVSKAGVVYVVGDVQRPSGFLMDNNEKLSVLQALALAGGPNRTAALGKAKVIRKSAAGLQEIPMPLGKILAAKADDAALLADDILFVPSSAAKSAAHRGLEAIVGITTGLAIYRF